LEPGDRRADARVKGKSGAEHGKKTDSDSMGQSWETGTQDHPVNPQVKGGGVYWNHERLVLGEHPKGAGSALRKPTLGFQVRPSANLLSTNHMKKRTASGRRKRLKPWPEKVPVEKIGSN